MDKQLREYVKKQISAGYNANAVRDNLIKYGYNIKDVDDAIWGMQRKKFPFIILVIAAVIAVAAISLMLIKNNDETDLQSIGLILEPAAINIKAGDSLLFDARVSGADGKVAVLEYQIIDSKGRMINSGKENIFEQSKRIEIAISSNAAPGKYNLKAAVSADKKTTNSFFAFEITSESGEIILNECATCADTNECIAAICGKQTGYKCLYKSVVPCCGNAKCEIGEDYALCSADCAAIIVEIDEPEITEENIPMLVKEKSSDVSAAIDFCASLSKEKFRDICYGALADETDYADHCKYIVSDSRRDDCYKIFILDGDFSLCGSLTNPFTRESCEKLRESE